MTDKLPTEEARHCTCMSRADGIGSLHGHHDEECPLSKPAPDREARHEFRESLAGSADFCTAMVPNTSGGGEACGQSRSAPVHQPAAGSTGSAQAVDLNTLYPKYNCPVCGDWFHMPWKFCKCGQARTEARLRAESAQSVTPPQGEALAVDLVVLADRIVREIGSRHLPQPDAIRVVSDLLYANLAPTPPATAEAEGTTGCADDGGELSKTLAAMSPADLDDLLAKQQWQCNQRPWPCNFSNAASCGHDRMLTTDCPKICGCVCHANACEAEIRTLESTPEATAMRLLMQSLMPCGHAYGNLLTCSNPPFGCVICLNVRAATIPTADTELKRLQCALRSERLTIRSWQKHADRMAKLLGCIAIDSEIEAALRKRLEPTADHEIVAREIVVKLCAAEIKKVNRRRDWKRKAEMREAVTAIASALATAARENTPSLQNDNRPL
jgi:hypothetical protein